MAIRKEQPGAARAAAAAGTAIGESQKAIREQAIAAQQASQQATLKAREASEQRALAWDVEKLEIRSRQEFEQELRRNQFVYDKENRAQEWEIEKLTIASQMDFERDEKKRQTKLDRIDSSWAAIDAKVARGDKSEKDVELLRFNLEQEKIATEIGSRRSFANTLPKQSTLSLLSGGDSGGISESNPLGFDMGLPFEQGISDESIQLESNQKFKVISPEGDEEEIDAAEWKAYKGRGYILADIVNLRKKESNVDLSRYPQFNVPL